MKDIMMARKDLVCADAECLLRPSNENDLPEMEDGWRPAAGAGAGGRRQVSGGKVATLSPSTKFANYCRYRFDRIVNQEAQGCDLDKKGCTVISNLLQVQDQLKSLHKLSLFSKYSL